MLVYDDQRSLYDSLAFDYLFALMMAASGVLYLADPRFKERFTHLGLPFYFRAELAILKLAGAAVLLLPFPDFLKEWASAGFFIVLTSASIAHRVKALGASSNQRNARRLSQ